MHIKSVSAQAFGPLCNESLEMSPGLTVIQGDNESGKSSWHAAIYAALCGRRRGKGSSLAERDFVLRRRPWSGDRWQVSCEVELDDGRSVTLEHDLDGKVACRALDSRGRDVSSDILYEGAPDGSRWLGLNRRTFAATACVNQAELLRVLDAADALQTDIQRAATTAGKDETAAAALDALRAYMSEHVGKDQVNSKRPLRRALTELEHARAAAYEAGRAHEDYLRLAVCVDEAATALVEARAARERAEATEAAAARLLQAVDAVTAAEAAAGNAEARAEEKQASASAASAKQQRAHELATSVPTSEPRSSRAGDAIAQQVSRALGAWDSAPELVPVTGVSASQLRGQLAALPQAPAGDVEVDPTVERLRDAHLQAAAVVDRDRRRRVDNVDAPDARLNSAAAFGVPSLHRLADRLAAPAADVDPQLEAAVADAAQRRDVAAACLRTAEECEAAVLTARSAGIDRARGGAAHHTMRIVASVAAICAVLGLLFLVVGRPLLGAALMVAGSAVAAGAWGYRRLDGWRLAGRGGDDAAHRARLVTARTELATAREASLRAERAYLEATARCDAARRFASVGAAEWRAAVDEARAAGLPVDAGKLRSLADQAQHVINERDALERWRRDCAADEDALHTSRQRLESALADRGHVIASDGDVLTTFAGYEAACAQRAEQARRARSRASLEEQLVERIAVEEAAERTRQLRCAATSELHRAALSAGLETALGQSGDAVIAEAAASQLAERLRLWLHERAKMLAESDRQRRDWQELRTLLGDGSLEDLDSEVAREDSAAEAARAGAARARAEVVRLSQLLLAAAAQAGVDVPADATSASALLADRRSALATAREREREASDEAARLRGQVAERESALPSVAEAEEAVDRAQRELDRVRSLEEALRLSMSYLQTAQEQTYNTLAPVLGSALERWLPEVTGGRYERALVDPETLEVSVATATGSMRSAARLSVGTAEQIYLLLRVALAEHLASKSTVSPLLLDDVTVQADPTRTEAVMRMCKALADEGRQVIVFAQDPGIAAWAEDHLDSGRDSLVRLPIRLAA